MSNEKKIIKFGLSRSTVTLIKDERTTDYLREMILNIITKKKTLPRITIKTQHNRNYNCTQRTQALN